MEKNVLKLENITKIYEKNNEKIIAVDNVNFTFLSNKFYAVMGHSGSGKTTMLNILGTLENPTKGILKINDKDVHEFNEKHLSKLRNKEIGFIFQNYALDPNLKAIENVMLPMYINEFIKKEDIKKKALELLKYVNLGERMNHYPKELSGGEMQRVGIARALANNPKIILADEPTGNLDEENEKIIFNILKELAKDGKCVIVVSHNENILQYADVVLKMNKGKINVNL